jgi:hypothetical protein
MDEGAGSFVTGEAAEPLEVPFLVRSRLARHLREPDKVLMAAEAIRDTLYELKADSTSRDLRTAGNQLQAYAEYAQLVLLQLAALGGELRGLACAAEMRRSAPQGSTSEPQP